jgi:GNAT superfamily N-acetyltransferase
MKVVELKGKAGFKVFTKLGEKFYQGNPHYRGTEASIEKLLLIGPTEFHKHATVKFFAVEDDNEMVARFAFIYDHKLPDYLQVSFFEAHPNLDGLWKLIKSEARTHFKGVPKVVVGLNGHLNYGAGFLLNHFGRWFNQYNIKRLIRGVKTRPMNKKNIKQEIAIYTELNNKCFKEHPYWADRTIKEDLELFYPFRYLLKDENLIFAEYNGEPIGFFLWYPDFNQLVNGSRDLNVFDVIKYKSGLHINTFRFAEIGILPKYRRTSVNIALIQHCVNYIERLNIEYCECGFIFEENVESIALMKRFMNRFFEHEVEPYRRFAVFEGELWN